MRRHPPHHRAEKRARAERAEQPDQRRTGGEGAVGEIAVIAELDPCHGRQRSDRQHDQVRLRWTNSVQPQGYCRNHRRGPVRRRQTSPGCAHVSCASSRHVTMNLDQLVAPIQRAALATADLATGRAGNATALDEHHRVGWRPVLRGDGAHDAVGHVVPCVNRVARGSPERSPAARACRRRTRMPRIRSGATTRRAAVRLCARGPRRHT